VGTGILYRVVTRAWS